MYTAIVWIGLYGSWSKGGFATKAEAANAAFDYANAPGSALAGRDDVTIEVEGPADAPAGFAPYAVGGDTLLVAAEI